MKAYGSAQRWRKDAPGNYTSPCGDYTAVKQGYGRWRMVSLRDQRWMGPYVSLAECQEIAERRSRVR